MICDCCNKPVVLTPSAAQRAKKYGGKPADYEALFPRHSQCEIDKRNAYVRSIMPGRDTTPKMLVLTQR